jgi:hypothetical protein
MKDAISLLQSGTDGWNLVSERVISTPQEKFSELPRMINMEGRSGVIIVQS